MELRLAALVVLVVGVAGIVGCDARPGDATSDACVHCPDSGRHCAARETACTDGIDDDCDGTTDCDDVDCASACASCRPTPESTDAACTNHVDDDCDGNVDCMDPDCRGASLTACFGDWVVGHPAPLAVSDRFVSNLQVVLTPDGFDTIGTLTDVPAPSPTLEIRARGTAATLMAGPIHLEDPPNDYLRTCAGCVVYRDGTRTYFQRWGVMSFTRVPAAVGDSLEGTMQVQLEEVSIDASGEAQPIVGGRLFFALFEFSGMAVSGGVVASGGSSLGLTSTGAGSSAPEPGAHACGNVWCGLGETSATCPMDCPACAPSSFTRACANGVVCPAGSQCISRGRCQCIDQWDMLDSMEVDLEGEDCSRATACTTGHCTGADWTCMAPGCGNALGEDVDCGGWRCPHLSTCGASSGSCLCPMGTSPHLCDGTPCSGSACTPHGWSCS